MATNTKEPDHYLAILKASYDYAPQSDDEIAIKEDQPLFLIERTDEDWWKVKVKGESQDDEGPMGLVPAAYVEQAEPSSLVKVLYDYDAMAPGELSVKEDEILQLFETDGDWILAQSNQGDGAGYVPGNYVEAAGDEQEEPQAPAASQIVIPDSPPRPVSTYVDPADRVASHKITADDIKTWSVSEVDKKGKKKKGTLGIGNGSLFFASESDKAAVQKWQTANVIDVSSEKAKHVQIEIGGPNPVALHFHAGSKENAEAIVAKTQSSKAIATGGAAASPSSPSAERRLPPASRNVHFDTSSPVIIPLAPAQPEEDSDQEEEVQQAQATGEYASVLYDFTADGDDEMSVAEGEQLFILERDGDDWWKCQNAKGQSGMVPASYLELAPESQNGAVVAAVAPASTNLTKAKEEEAARRSEEQRQRAEQERAEKEEQERLQREEEERNRKKREAQEKARAAAAAAEAERERRKIAAVCKAASPPPKSPPAEAKKEASSSKPSAELTRPPPDKTRIWHDRTGQFRVEAAFLGFTNGKLRLHKVNGVTVEVPAEKMSMEDMRFVEKIIAKRQRGANAVTSDDEVPLALTPAAKTRSSQPTPQPPKKGPSIDWFDFFLGAGCDVDDCTRYASSFERDKIDEAILPDITEGTMRSLGLREGDIIRVKKAIEKRKPGENLNKPSAHVEAQIRRDEELARQLQEQEQRSGGGRSPAPNLFAGPGGTLKTNVRRGRPQPKGSLPLSNVDIKALSDASDAIQRSSSPKSAPPSAAPSVPAVQPPPRTSSAAVPVASGFDDDAWTVRPSSAKPAVETPPAPAPVAPAPAAPPAPVVQPGPATSAPATPAPAAAPTPATTSPTSLANTTESDIFQQLERLKELRKPATPKQMAPPPSLSPPALQQANTFPMSAGMGMSHSPVPMGQLSPSPTLQTPSGMGAPGPRGPYAPVPANQGLLQPLIPTQTGFTSFVPTRPPAFNQTPSPAPPLNANFQQPVGHTLSPPHMNPIMSHQTGMPMNGVNGGGLIPMQTGMPMNSMGSGMGMMSQPAGFNPMNNLNTGFGQMSLQPNGNSGFLQSNPTGFNPSMNSGNFGNFSNTPPVPPLPSSQARDTTPANVFASMKSGTFEDESAPRSADIYDPFRNSVQTQPTGWMGGYSQGNMGYR